MNYFSEFLNALRGGKDQFTQTVYTNRHNSLTGRSTVWVDPSVGKLFDLYNTTPQLKAVIDKKAAMFSNGVWIHTKNDKVIENSEVVKLLNNPNPLCNGNEFLRQYIISKSIYANCFINKNMKASSRVPGTIYVLPAANISINTTGKIYKQSKKDEIIKGYELCIYNGESESFDTKDIIHFIDSNPDNPILGTSKFNALTMPISNLRGAYGFKNRIITNNAALGILSSGNKDGMGVALDPDEAERLDKGYSQRFGMQDGKSNLLITEASIDYTSMSFPTKDLLLDEEIDGAFKIIIDTFGLNKNIFSPSSDSKFSNMNEALKMAYQDCIIPEAEDFALGLAKNFQLDLNTEKLELSFDHLYVLRENENEKAKTLKTKAEAVQILRANGMEAVANEIEF